MLTGLKKYLSPSSLETSEKMRTSRFINTILIALISFNIIFLPILIFVFPFSIQQVATSLVTIAISVALAFLTRRGHIRTVSIILVSLLFLAISLVIFSEGGVRNPIINMYVLLVVMTSLLLGENAAITIIILSIISSFLALQFENTDQIIMQETQLSSLQSWLLIITNLIFVAVVVRLEIRSYNSALQSARKNEEDLLKSNQALEKSQQRWRSLVENAPDFIVELDMDKVIRFTNRTNPATTPKQLVGEMFTTIAHPDERERVDKVFETVIETHRAQTIEGRGRRNNEQWFSANISPIMNGCELSGFTVAARDITEKKTYEEQQKKLALEEERFKAMRDFIGNISHDLKTPLTIINTSLYLLGKISDPEKQSQKFELIKKQTNLLEQYIQDIITMSELQHAIEYHKVVIKLNQYIDNVVEKLSSIIEGREQIISLSLSETLSNVYGSPKELNRVLINLVDNASKYSPEKGVIEIKSYDEESHVVIEVIDNGIGISTDNQEHIFKRFYRVDEARNQNTIGIGLGLAIVKQVVDLHGGTITVSSELGQGSNFKVMLPIYDIVPSPKRYRWRINEAKSRLKVILVQSNLKESADVSESPTRSSHS